MLDFSDRSFDTFTFDSIGICVKEVYKLSKGRSLKVYCEEGEEEKVIKLLSDMLEYYEVEYYDEITGKDEKGHKVYYKYYRKCKEIIERIKDKNNAIFTETIVELKEKFSSGYIDEQLNLMIKLKENNPTESIGKAKELIESCCKTILDEEQEVYLKADDVGKLVKKTMKILEIDKEDIDRKCSGSSEAEIIKKDRKSTRLNSSH